MQKDPIGLMDSGVGGLTVLKEVQRLMPNENTVFLGDQARLPYGPRPVAEVTTFTRQIASYLKQRANIKMLIIACNTATAAALPQIQQEFSFPVVGVIAPGAQAAVTTTKNHRIGVIATEGTVKSDQYRQDILNTDAQAVVKSAACPAMVTLAEQNDLTSSHALKVVSESLASLRGQRLDTLVMGCTHYPLLAGVIQQAIGAGVTLVDPGMATAQRAQQILAEQHLTNTDHDAVAAAYWTTGNAQQFDELATDWLGMAVHAQHLPVAELARLTEEN
ncbi:glutamate racemase [Levilactobacillus yonginensis]|uniref:glutamate racemase n=1 Tax=Levilactobacillus yonginensis TaxID=1054041 RepID=UPI000F77AB8F|nr:glutamate racemase [Levilactobacillus yonginensis]